MRTTLICLLSYSIIVQCNYQLFPLSSSYPGTVTRAVTPGLMTQHHTIICVHLRSPCYPPLTPFDFFLSFPSPDIPYPLSLHLSAPSPIHPSLPLLYVPLVFISLSVLYFLFFSPPPPCAMSKICQSEPGRQNCQYCSW